MLSDFVTACTNDVDTPVYFYNHLQHIHGNVSNLASTLHNFFFRENILCTLPFYV
jgi:hypothetical protein